MKKEGLHPVEISAGFNPAQLRFPRFIFPDTLGRMEKEEAAGRILFFSKEAGAWVGVSWPNVAKAMKSDMNVLCKQWEVDNHNREEKERLAGIKIKRFWLGLVTLGLWFLFTRAPKGNFLEMPPTPFDLSLLSFNGSGAILDGIRELINEEFLECREVGGEEIFFPTLKLAKAVEKFAVN